MTHRHDNLPPHVMELLRKRYFLKDEAYLNYYGHEGAEKSWAEVARRVASVIANGNMESEHDYYDDILNMRFIPNSPTLFGAGVPGLCLSACFVLPIEDSIEGWGEAIKTGLLVQTKGGGIGWPLHMLRPKGSKVSGKSAKAAGPLAFLRSWNKISGEFSQAVRNGANMGLMRVDHPDIEEFVEAKEKDGELSTFNISVGVTDSFMAAVQLDEKFPLKWRGQIVKEISARKLFERMCYLGWKNGDPGLVNLSRIQDDNLHPELGELYVNPCSEATIMPNWACNLGSVNVAAFVITTENGPMFDYVGFRRAVRRSYRFLDDLIDVNEYPTAEIAAAVRRFRPIGLGLMGIATAMMLMGYRYGDEDGQAFVEDLFKRLQGIASEMNRELALSRGAYPAAKGELRNATMTTVAPTGSISMIAGVSSGIEPYFSFDTQRRIIAGKEETYEVAKSDDPRLNVTAKDLTPAQHIAVVAVAQKYVSMSISKTINLPPEATVESVMDAYMLAFKSGLKGITVYRDGSREDQVITTAATPKKPLVASIERPAVLKGQTYKEHTGCGNLYVTINRTEDGRIAEVFVRAGKLGGCSANIEGMGRMVSAALRHGVPKDVVIKQLRGIICPSCVRTGAKVLSCPDALGRMLLNQKDEGEKPMVIPVKLLEPGTPDVRKCPECGEALRSEGGCYTCPSCGYSKCG